MTEEMSGEQAACIAEARRWRLASYAVGLLNLGFIVLFGIGASQHWFGALTDGGAKHGAEDYARWGTFWAATVNGFLGSIALAYVGRRAMKKTALAAGTVDEKVAGFSDSVEGEKWEWQEKLNLPESPPRASRRDWFLLAVILIAAGALRWPRMGLSFYNDEAHTFRTYVAGRFKQADDGTVSWRPVRWGETLWLNKVGNNQAPCSIFGRLFYDGWRKNSGAGEGAVCETAVRLPQFIAGMASLVVLWLAARRMAGPGMARWVLLLAALHPWHVRYSTEARAYGILLLGVSWCFYALQRALEDGRWRWWLSLGLAEFLCLWSFPGAIYFVFVFDGIVLAVLAGRVKRDGWGPVGKFATGVLAGGMATLQLMLPTVPQIAEAMRQLESLKGSMSADWWSDAFAGIFFGIRGWDRDPANPDNLALLRETMQWPWSWALVATVVALWVAGVFLLVRSRIAGAIMAVAGAVAVCVGWALMSAQGRFLHPWYVLFAVPGVVVSVAAGIEWLTERKWPAGVLVAVVVSACWLRSDLVYLRHGKENLRGVAQAGRVLAGGRGVYAAMLADVDIYDSRVVILKSAADMDAEISRARVAGRPLVVSVGHRGMVDSVKVLERLTGSGEFERAGIFRGFEEEQFTHQLFRLLPGP